MQESENLNNQYFRNIHRHYRSICISWHAQLRSECFCWSKVLLHIYHCWQQLVNLDYGENAEVVTSGVTGVYGACNEVPSSPENRHISLWCQQSHFRLNIPPWLCTQCYYFSLNVMLISLRHFTGFLRLVLFCSLKSDTEWLGHGEMWDGEVWTLPHVSQGHPWDLQKTDKKVFG